MLKYEITHKYNEIETPAWLEEELIKRVRWETAPTFLTQGRTAWYELEEPFEIEYNGQKHTIKAVKMKGVGVYNPEGRHADSKNTKPIPPTDKIYKRDEPHFGFDKDSNIVKIHSDDAPYGGICHDRALREYDNAKVLFENDVPTIIPYIVVKYNDLFFNGKQMGAVLSLCTEKYPYRLLQLGWENKYVEPELLDYYDEIKKSFGIVGDITDANVKLLVSKKIANQFGKIVRELTKSGLYIHSGGWENIQYDMCNKQIFLTDLDSTRDLNLVSEKMKAITALRDFISNLYRYTNKLYYSRSIKIYDCEKLYEYNVILDLLKGYLPESNEEALKEISLKILDFFMPYFVIMKKNEDSLKDIPKKVRKSFKFDTDMFYILCLLLIYPEFLKSNSSVVSTNSLTLNELKEISKKYLSSNYIYIESYLK